MPTNSVGGELVALRAYPHRKNNGPASPDLQAISRSAGELLLHGLSPRLKRQAASLFVPFLRARTVPRVGIHAAGDARLGKGKDAELGRPSLDNAKAPIFSDLVRFNMWPRGIKQSLKA